MRSLIIIAFTLIGTAAQAVEIGDTRAVVIQELGSPMGELDLGDRVRLMFTEGDVTLVDGVVASHAIKSAAQLQRDESIRQQIAAQWAERNAADLAERLDRGRTWLDYLKLSSTKLTDQDIKSLMGHWTKIRSDYPAADIAAEYDATIALAEARADEIARNREEQRIATLERRVAEAEQRAVAAQQQASYAQQVSYNTYPAWYYPPATRSVVVITGNGSTCIPAQWPRQNPQQPILSANYSSDNVNISYTSGGGRNLRPAPRPIVITKTGE